MDLIIIKKTLIWDGWTSVAVGWMTLLKYDMPYHPCDTLNAIRVGHAV